MNAIRLVATSRTANSSHDNKSRRCLWNTIVCRKHKAIVGHLNLEYSHNLHDHMQEMAWEKEKEYLDMTRWRWN